jgi:hypothetical protein
MADKIATDFISDMKATGRNAISWFKKIVAKTQRAAAPAKYGRKEIINNRNIGIDTRPIIGRMYLFQYDAKWKDKLPWWDMWPLIFPFDYAKGGFYGINVHYLPPNDRADLMIRLIKAHGSSGKMDERFKMRLSYSIITKFKPAIPCIKRYLFSQVQGRGFYGISGQDWSYAAALPLQKFQKATARKVWHHSKQMY